jgi:6,7-dimethyl-8-ribityllumazine synthase
MGMVNPGFGPNPYPPTGFNPGVSVSFPSVTIPSFGAPGGGRVLVPIHRFYHPGHLDHLYSTNVSEGTPHGYASEGVAFQLSSSPAAGLVPVYRYWRAEVKDHFYTTNVSEMGTVTPGSMGKFGYVCEGVLGYISPVSQPGTVPVYRYWKESVSDHFYTTNASEIGAVVQGSTGNHGYVCEGVLGYSFI